MRIAVYGGSYNPIHKGHTSLASALVRQGLAEEVWLLVSPLNPLKSESTSTLAAYDHRLRMAEIAVQDMQGVKVSDFESRLPIPSYMLHTLQALSTQYPQHEFVLVIGADNWHDFHKWYRSEDILQQYSLIIYNRPGYPLQRDSLPKNVTVADTPLYDISSTQLRQAIFRSEDTAEWLDADVRAYITEHALYQ